MTYSKLKPRSDVSMACEEDSAIKPYINAGQVVATF
jgi:hypothetical protein